MFWHQLREKYSHSGLVWPALHHILSEYGDLLCKSPYSVQTREKIRTRIFGKRIIFRNWMQPKNCKLSRYYSRLKHWHLQTKFNDEILYIHAKSNHPANILKQLPISIKTRLSNLSSNSEILHEASKHYQNILNQSGYDYKLQYKPPNNGNENWSKSPKNGKTSSGSTRLFQRMSPTTSVNISFF